MQKYIEGPTLFLTFIKKIVLKCTQVKGSRRKVTSQGKITDAEELAEFLTE